MRHLKRLFSTSSVKGSRNYLDTQKKYEIIRTLLYFGISLSLFAAGYIQTGEKANLLTIVAVLGCLPASKSAVSAIMFLRFRSCGGEAADAIEQHSEGLECLYDMVFTSEKKNFVIGHLAVRGGTVCGYSEDKEFPEEAFRGHIEHHMKMEGGTAMSPEGHKSVTVKIFTSLARYTERLDQMQHLEPEEERTAAILSMLKSISL